MTAPSAQTIPPPASTLSKFRKALSKDLAEAPGVVVPEGHLVDVSVANDARETELPRGRAWAKDRLRSAGELEIVPVAPRCNF